MALYLLWIFIYLKISFSKVQFTFNRVQTKEYKVKHYLPNKFYMNVAKDKWHSTYGRIIAF